MYIGVCVCVYIHIYEMEGCTKIFSTYPLGGIWSLIWKGDSLIVQFAFFHVYYLKNKTKQKQKQQIALLPIYSLFHGTDIISLETC